MIKKFSKKSFLVIFFRKNIVYNCTVFATRNIDNKA